MNEKDYRQLIDDVQSMTNIRERNISRHEGDPWSKFARVRILDGLFVKGLKKRIRRLEEGGYVVSLGIEDEDDVLLYIHVTYDAHQRVFQGVDDAE